MPDNLLWNRAGDAAPVLLLAHGAGAPMDSEFMNALSARLQQAGVTVARFEFPYMSRRRQDRRRRPPDRQPVLLEAFSVAAASVGGTESIFVGGKSMGGRMATLLAASSAVRGAVCFGYPFHPPGRPDRLRTAHLEDMATPVLICQGERDPFGRREEVESLRSGPGVQLHWLPDGDHDLKPRRRSGIPWQANLADAAAAAARWMRGVRGSIPEAE